MVGRILVVALNAYREAVRAWLFVALVAVAVATNVYAVLVAALSLHQEARTVSDVGAGSISLCAAGVAIVMGATSLNRELSLRTIYPILARPLYRHEYVLGKFVGTVGTILVFIALDAAMVLGVLALETGQKPALVVGAAALLVAILGVLMLRARYTRVYVLLPWSVAALLAMALLASTAGDERRLVLAAIALTAFETCIVTAITVMFSSFSSPFLTAVFAFGVFAIGRSADTLAHVPARQFGETMKAACAALARVFPNLHLYVPSRPVLLGHVAEIPIWRYVATSGLHALFYTTIALALASLAFRRRDFA